MIYTIAFLALLMVFLSKYRRRQVDSCKGPPSWPIFGNFFAVPAHQPYVRFAEWKKTYGEFIPLTIFGRRLFVLNSREVALDLFEKRSAIYSDRPRRTMAELCGLGKALLFQSYASDSTRKGRKLMHAELSKANVGRHIDMQYREILHFVQRLSMSPDNLVHEIERLASSIILAIAYGYQIKDANDAFVSLADSVMDYVSKVISPNNFLVDSIPVLRYIPEWMPGAGFKKEAKICRELLNRMNREPYLSVLKQMSNGTARPSFVSRHLELNELQLTEEEHDLLMWTAGVEVNLWRLLALQTVATLKSFFLAMIIHPEVQNKAKKELDAVIAKEGRLPTLDDKPSLPYIDCIIQELFRWRPVTPMAAHSTLVDDVYRGIAIPAGSVIMANTWAFTHDDEVYQNPEKFYPERFLDGDLPDPRVSVFGFGRRSCPGAYLVDNLLWMLVATTLSAFDILPEVSDDGTENFPSADYTSGAVVEPLPYKCRIVPRSSNLMDLVSYALAGKV
ncbi:hypothetical protein D9613_005667 [Agrocybe pediades]|uniref:Cytochrome P450 n=1 Tax=Agrocybe pediades TaxID=84607 RepID=A0A8H4VNL6_9AGAR|nr:hypothetical protein D9613_005667 [Agrocybe pediades]